MIGSCLCKKESLELGQLNRQWYLDTRHKNYINLHTNYKLHLNYDTYNMLKKIESSPTCYQSPRELKLCALKESDSILHSRWFNNLFSNVKRLYLYRFEYMGEIPFQKFLRASRSNVSQHAESPMEIIDLKFKEAGASAVASLWCSNLDDYLVTDGNPTKLQELRVQLSDGMMQVIKSCIPLQFQILNISNGGDIVINEINDWLTLFGNKSLTKIVIDDKSELVEGCYLSNDDMNNLPNAVNVGLKEIEIQFLKQIVADPLQWRQQDPWQWETLYETEVSKERWHFQTHKDHYIQLSEPRASKNGCIRR